MTVASKSPRKRRASRLSNKMPCRLTPMFERYFCHW
jgi:hypothetical protein